MSQFTPLYVLGGVAAVGGSLVVGVGAWPGETDAVVPPPSTAAAVAEVVPPSTVIDGEVVQLVPGPPGPQGEKGEPGDDSQVPAHRESQALPHKFPAREERRVTLGKLLLGVLVWLVVSVPVALLVGKVIRAGLEETESTDDPQQRLR